MLNGNSVNCSRKPITMAKRLLVWQKSISYLRLDRYFVMAMARCIAVASMVYKCIQIKFIRAQLYSSQYGECMMTSSNGNIFRVIIIIIIIFIYIAPSSYIACISKALHISIHVKRTMWDIHKTFIIMKFYLHILISQVIKTLPIAN